MQAFCRQFPALLLAAFWLASPVSGFAQAEKKELPPPGYFRLISWEGAITDLYYLRGDKKVPVQISPFAKSEHYPLPQESVISFFRDGTNADGQVVAIPVAKVPLNETWKYPLLVVLPVGTSGKWAFSAYDEDPANFHAGDIRLINTTPERVIASLSGKETVVSAGQLQTVSLQPKALEVVDVGISVDIGGQRQPVYQRGWELEPQMRITAFVILDQDHRYRVRRLREDESTFLPRKPKDGSKTQPVAQ